MSYSVNDRRRMFAPRVIRPCTCGRQPAVHALRYENAHAVVCEACNRCVSRDNGEGAAIAAWNFEQAHGAVLQ